MRRSCPVNGLGDHVLFGIDELSHGVSPSGQTCASGVKIEWIIRANFDNVAFFQSGVRVGHSNQVMCFERQVQAGLVAQMFNALHKAVFAVSPCTICSGRRPIWVALSGAPPKTSDGQYVDAWLAQTAGCVDADRIFINVARAAKLDQTARRPVRLHGSPWSLLRSGRG